MLSYDGQYIYTPTSTGVEQVLTSTLTADLSIPVTAGPVYSVAVEPGQSQTIAVGGLGFLQIFDGTVPRPNSLPINGAVGAQVLGLQWDPSTSILYGTDNPGAGAPYPECIFGVDASGITGVVSCIGSDENTFNFANGLGYAPGGNIVDPTKSWSVVATLSAPNTTLSIVFPDATTGKAFAFATNPGGCAIQSFNLTTDAPIASLNLPCGGGANLVRWGTDGLALSTSNYVITISGQFVGP